MVKAKKKILITAYNLKVGGIETALINMLKQLVKEYHITLILENNDGPLLREIPKDVTIEIYNVNNNKNVILRKIINRLNILRWISKNKNKYYFSACFAPYSIPGSILARHASKNNAIWVHSNYLLLYKNNIKKVKSFFYKRKFQKYKSIIFVSNEALEDFTKVFLKLKNKCRVLDNIIDYKQIINKSTEEIDEVKDKEFLITFIGRLDEESKRITRIINVAEMLFRKYNIKVFIVGDGQDKSLYEDLIKRKGLNKIVFLLGEKSNPYPYYMLSDLIILTSDYEGFPVVCMEAIILKKNFISTVSLSSKYLKLSDYGLIVNKPEQDIANGVIKFINKEIIYQKDFNLYEYEEHLIKDLIDLIGDKNGKI